jgi:hypothetical protein
LTNDFRRLLFDLDSPRLALARGVSAREFGKLVENVPFLKPVLATWRSKYKEPFRGLTCDGCKEEGLFELTPEGAPTRAMTEAAARLLRLLDIEQKERLRKPIDSEHWRLWSNPEFLVNDYGLRLEDLTEPLRSAILDLIEASLSARGYQKACGCMRTNAFLGQLTQLPNIMNEWSYNFQLFGEPSASEPWGWNLYGHHLCLNCFVLGEQMIISPTFMGAEPNVIDEGPNKGTCLFTAEESDGLAFMRSLSKDLRAQATVYARMQGDPNMPADRYHSADGFHLGGAFQDNRIVPYEGVSAQWFSADEKERLLKVVQNFLEYLPPGPLAAKMRQVERHLDQTYWSWIGGHDDEDPFYYRVQSPVVMVEFDHHPGIWLTNQMPAKCHIHTVVRTPNGNDYGRDLLKQHYARVHPGRAPGAA